MPKFTVPEKSLFSALSRDEMTMEEFDELCFEFGIELDEWEDVKEEGQAVRRDYKIEIPANRYDLLCFEGLTRALNVFLGNTKQAPIYRVLTGVVCHKLRVLPETREVRPFCLGAVLRGVKLDKTRYDSLISLQEKLHHNICRERTLASIGIHNFDSIEGPFTYEALPPEEIKFVPLNQTKEFTARELMQLYKTDAHLKPYLHIIEKKPRYPVIYDRNRVLLSLPPIINGNHTRLDENTRNLFIDVTSTDLNKAHIVLNTVVTMFSVYCDEQFTVEPCEVEQPDGSKKTYPDLSYRTETIALSYLNQGLGLHEGADAVSTLLTRMCLTSHPDESGLNIVVSVPPTRADVIHPCDVMEDYAIAYGYNRIPRALPQMSTTGGQQPLNKLTDLLRLEMAQAGFTELLTFTMCARKDISEKLNLDLAQIPAVHVANPKASEFQVVRTSLLPGILKTVSSNLIFPKPIRVFEISDVVHKTASRDVRAENTRHLCAAYYNTTAGFEVIHGLLERVMVLVNVRRGGTEGYELEGVEHPSYFPGRCVQVTLHGKSIGKFGVLHPSVLANFHLPMPCSVLEINIETML